MGDCLPGRINVLINYKSDTAPLTDRLTAWAVTESIVNI